MLPVLLSMTMAEFWRSRHVPSLIAFIAGLLAFYALLICVQVKSHALVLGIMLVCTALLMQQGLRRLVLNCVMVGLISLAGFSAIEVVQRGWYGVIAPTVVAPAPGVAPVQRTEAPVQRTEAAAPASPPAQQSTARPAETIEELRPRSAMDIVEHQINNLSQRMAIAIPFYVSVFSNAAERCGIEANTLRRVLNLPASNCSLSEKISDIMWPSTKRWVH